MISVRAAGLIVAPVFLMLMAPEASACTCEGRVLGKPEKTSAEKFSEADLVVKGRMKTVTYGVEFANPDEPDQPFRMTRGDIDIKAVLKGTFEGKTIEVYTGAGNGDCGRLPEFIGQAVYYNHEKFGEFELGLIRSEVDGKTFYMTSICDYAKGPEDEEAQP
ncbi:hypothetical protein [Ensifer adhaerens]|uniref:hypothetical protein n=1 Tax=Ensifer adhaerens TaxID=106592 RepID=UPI00098F28D9|nr:hypothetical protein [Ensifer adhaerens]